MARHQISNSDDVIDSRDVIARIDELESERQELLDAITALEEEADNPEEGVDEAATLQDAKEALKEFDEDDDEGGELTRLKALAEEAEGYSEDWRHGATLIRESYWVEYCQELVSDIGDLPRDIPGYIEIDWEATARNLESDYTEVEYGDVTYLVR